MCQVSGHSPFLGENPVFAGCWEEEEEKREHVAGAVPVVVTIKSQHEPGDAVASVFWAAWGEPAHHSPKHCKTTSWVLGDTAPQVLRLFLPQLDLCIPQEVQDEALPS